MTVATSNYDPTAAIVETLRAGGYRVAKASGGWQAQCPAHDDQNPSLSIGTGADGRALLYCHAGCGIVDICDALSVDPAALFADYDPGRASSGTVTHMRAWRRQKERQPKPPPNTKRVKTNHWDYHDADGTHVARVVRYDKVDLDTGEIVGKTFTQHAWDAEHDRQLPNLGGIDMPLYQLPLVRAGILAGRRIIICEGERDADTATAHGDVATTCPMGAGSWRPWHTQQLEGAAFVAIVADNDRPGLEHAAHIRAELDAVGIPCAVLLPADGCKDLTEHVDAGHSLDDMAVFDGGTGQPGQADDDTYGIDADLIRDRFPALDWHELWADESEEEWIVEPILPARRLVAVYSKPKVGKSLLMLELAVAIARGTEVLGVTPPRPYRVLYVDFENDPRMDTRDRLKAMGYKPDDLGDLVVLSFPSMAALDTAAGGEELLSAAAAYECEVVVIDTVSRAIKGEENDNDTWLNFYRHTGLAVKQAGLALIRLDHTGKDESKGQRGGSAKSGDVDAVWRLSKVTETTFRLDCEDARLPITEKTLVMHRESSPRLRHQVDAAGAAAAWSAKVERLVGLLDANGVPNDAGERVVRQWKTERGEKASNEVIAAVVKARKARLSTWEQDR